MFIFTPMSPIGSDLGRRCRFRGRPWSPLRPILCYGKHFLKSTGTWLFRSGCLFRLIRLWTCVLHAGLVSNSDTWHRPWGAGFRRFPGGDKHKAALTKKRIRHTCPSGHGSDDSGQKWHAPPCSISTYHSLPLCFLFSGPWGLRRSFIIYHTAEFEEEKN